MVASLASSGDPTSILSTVGNSKGGGFELWFQTYQNKKIKELNEQIKQKQVDTLADPDRTEAIDETEKDLKRVKGEIDSMDILQHKAKSVTNNLKAYNTNSQDYMTLKAKLHTVDPVTHKPPIMTADDARKLNTYRTNMINSLARVKDLSAGRDFKTEFKDAYDTNNDAPKDEKVTSFNTGPWNKGLATGRKKLESYLVPPAFKAGSSMMDQVIQGNKNAGGTGKEGDRFATYASLHMDKHVKFSLEQDSQFNLDVKHAVAHLAYKKNQKETTLKRMPRDRLSSSEMKKLSAIADKMKSDLGKEMTRLSDNYDKQNGMAAGALSLNTEDKQDGYTTMLSDILSSDVDDDQ